MDQIAKNNQNTKGAKKKKKRKQQLPKNKEIQNKAQVEENQREKQSANAYNQVGICETTPVIDYDTLRSAVVLSEIIGKPVCKRNRRNQLGRGFIR